MNEDVFNTSIRKFLKTLGVSAQREIEKAVRQAIADGKLKGSETLPAKATVTLGGLNFSHEITRRDRIGLTRRRPTAIPGCAKGAIPEGVRCAFRSAQGGRRQSTITPLALIGPAHLAISSFRNLPRYSGVARSFGTITAPSWVSRSRTAGVFIAWTAASLSFFTTSAGAFFGRKSAFQV